MILIKYATRGRTELFKRTISNILNTIQLPQSEFKILISADTDDACMNNEITRDFVSNFENIQLIFGKSNSKIDAINRDMEMSGEWDILINMSDDMFFITDGWGKIIIEDTIKEWGDSSDWFAHYSDGYVKDKLPTMSIMGKAYYDRTNYIYHPDYKSFSCDAEAMYVAMMLERYKYFGDDKILFHHIHPCNTSASNDETYKINALGTDNDNRVYWKRLNNLFDIKDPKIIPFAEHIGKNKHLYE